MDQRRPLLAGQSCPPSASASAASGHLRPSPTPNSAARSSRKKRRSSLPFAFPPLFQPNASSTSLIPSTAEGRPIPIDDDTTAHRTSALREFNSNYPSRHRYAKSTGAQNSTYSRPVLVRTYSGDPSRPSPSSAARSGTIGGQTGTSAFAPFAASGPAYSVRRVIAFRNPLTSKQNGLLSMARAKTKRQSEGHSDAPAKLPPMEAYSFKSMMANLEAEGIDGSISADLDRIAEICARSRYSLSNQYEVHVAPHGSGAAFLASVSPKGQHPEASGPTLQAVTSDDERNIKRHRMKRGGGIRKRSIAMGTLETIISSSGSSEGGNSKKKKKSAAEITEEVRGRAARKAADDELPAPSDADVEQQEEDTVAGSNKSPRLSRKKSASFATAMLESTTRQNQSVVDVATPRSSSSTLLSQPSLPQTSASHLEVRTESDGNPNNDRVFFGQEDPVAQQDGDSYRQSSNELSDAQGSQQQHALLGGWMPTWSFPPLMGLSSASAQAGTGSSHAEGSLRELLKATEVKNKGKAVEVPP